MDNNILALVGLALDILGFTMMLLFNPSLNMVKEHFDKYINGQSSVLTVPEYDDKTATKLRLSLALHKIGIKLIILGFVLQFIANLNVLNYS